MTKFAHIADTHIKNLKYHYEYDLVFKQLYKELKRERPDYIIHCGDIAHTKTQISPEFVEICSDFFKNLAAIAPTYIILGNHDGNLRNKSRQDAISPIVDALGIANLHLIKKAAKIRLTEPFTLNVLSIFDEDNWDLTQDPDRINIALYHGAVKGSVTDVGYVIEHGDVEIEDLKKFDYGFLGDIHKTNQKIDRKGKIRYAGSTVQQNFGETDDKGFLVWEIEDKDKFSVRHILLENPKPFVTIKLTKKGKIPKSANPKAGARIRLVSESNITLDVLKKAIEDAKINFKAESVTHLSKAELAKKNVDLKDGEIENLRDVEVQKKLMKEYLEEFEVEDDIMDKVVELNAKYNSLVEGSDDQLRNLNWKMKSMEWENLFNYGGDNSLDFEKMKGIIGIFGKNYSGKSSIIDSFLLGAFNTTSKPAKKNISFINQNKTDANIELKFDIGGEEYTISRSIEKYVKKLKGKTTDEAKVNVDFSCFDPAAKKVVELNGNTRAETDRNIRKYIGSIEDFLITSMSAQHGALQFVNEGSTKRKEILAKFLDLVFFEEKFKAAKEDSRDLKALIKKEEERNFKDEIFEQQSALIYNQLDLDEKKECCDILKNEKKGMEKELSLLEHKIKSVPAKIINVEKCRKELKNSNQILETLRASQANLEGQKEEKSAYLNKIKEFLSTFDPEEYYQSYEVGKEKAKQVKLILNEVKQEEIKKKMEEKKISLLDQVPCGDQFKTCKFIKDAFVAKTTVSELELALKGLQKEKEEAQDYIDGDEYKKAEEYVQNYEKLVEKKDKVSSELLKLKNKVLQGETKISSTESIISELRSDIKEYEDNKEAIENLEALIKEEKQLKKDLKQKENEYNTCEAEYIHLHTVKGQIEQKLETVKKEAEEYEENKKKFAAYHLFMTCYHNSGISYEIIKKRLPKINEEVQKILTGVVDFEVFFETEEKKLNILIQHQGHDPRPLELVSGAEKSIAAMAIRLALLNVSSLPKSDIFILDEPGTALDENNLEGFTRILQMIKNYFKTVLIISHMDSLKDIVDSTIDIDRVDGFARVNQ